MSIVVSNATRGSVAATPPSAQARGIDRRMRSAGVSGLVGVVFTARLDAVAADNRQCNVVPIAFGINTTVGEKGKPFYTCIYLRRQGKFGLSVLLWTKMSFFLLVGTVTLAWLASKALASSV